MVKSINTKKKLAIIGCGYWGSIITNNLINMGFKNISIYDSNTKNSNILKKKFNILSISTNYKKLLHDSSIEYFFLQHLPQLIIQL